MADITFVGATEGSAADGGDVTLDLTTLTGGSDSEPSEGDVVFVSYAIGDNDNTDFDMAMVTSGYTEVKDLFANDTREANLGVFYKFMGASPDASAQVDGQGGTDAGVSAVCMVFRNVKAVADGGPFDVAAAEATGTNTMHPDPPSIDHSGAAGIWTLIAVASGHAANGTSYTFPTGYDTTVDIQSVDDTRSTVGMAFNDGPSDPEDPGALTLSGVDSGQYAWCAVTMALSPAGAAATPLVIQDAAHGHAADNLGLTQHNVLAIQDATHGHAADNLVLTQHNILVIQDATHGHTADNLGLTQHNVLAIQDALHGHAAENLDLTPHDTIALDIQDGAHAHSAENVVLAQHNILAIQDAVHGHSAENIVLTQHNVLVIQDALHGHTADNVDIPGAPAAPGSDEQTYRLRRRRPPVGSSKS